MTNDPQHPENFPLTQFQVRDVCILVLTWELGLEHLSAYLAHLVLVAALHFAASLRELLEFTQVKGLYVLLADLNNFLEQVLLNGLGLCRVTAGNEQW